MKAAPEVTRIERPRLDARMVVDANGQIRDANQGAHRLLGYEDGSLVGLSLAWLMPPARHPQLALLSNAHTQERQLCLQTVLMREDGSLLAVAIAAQPCLSMRGPEQALTVELDEEPTVVAAPRSSFPASERSGTTETLAATTLPRRIAAQRQVAQPPVSRGTTQPTRLSARPPPVPPATPVQGPASEPRRLRFSPDLTARKSIGEQLSACRELVGWLDLQLQRQDAGGHELVRDRAVARVVLQELSTLLEQCRVALTK